MPHSISPTKRPRSIPRAPRATAIVVAIFAACISLAGETSLNSLASRPASATIGQAGSSAAAPAGQPSADAVSPIDHRPTDAVSDPHGQNGGSAPGRDPADGADGQPTNHSAESPDPEPSSPGSVDPAGPGCTSAPELPTTARVVHHGSRTADKVVALTFDDGWDPENVEELLAILQANRVNATFFPVGRAVARSPETWQAVAAAGFPIADHTWDHGDLTELCFADQVRDLTRVERAYADWIADAWLPVLRPPYGMFDDATLVAATAASLQAVVLWDVDTFDWSGSSVATIRARALGGRAGSIVLMHTSPDNTVDALRGIIRGYRARGFEFVTVGQLLGIDGPVPFP